MGWFDFKKNVREVEHIRGSRILDHPRKTKPKRWYDPADPATHDLPE